jgi:hypothetical protein
MLEKLGLPRDESANERTERLSSYYAHEAQQKKIKRCICEPDGPDDPQGCGFESDQTLSECPFCGKGGEVLPMPKDPPKADEAIENNVVAAGTKKDDGVAKLTSKELRALKKARKGEPSAGTAAPTDGSNSGELVTKSPESQALDLPGESTGTVADLDRLIREIREISARSEKEQGLSTWELGIRFAEIDDRKLWCLIKHEDGSYVYPNFNSFIAQQFGWSPGSTHAALLMRVARKMKREDAELMGISKAKTIIDTDFEGELKQLLIAFASELDDQGKPVHSVTDLRVKIQEMKTARLPPAPPTTPDMPDNNEEEGDDPDADDAEDEDDEPTSSPKPSPAPKGKPKPAEMVSVNFEAKKFSLPLVQKGSQFKPAKKLPDEPHGVLQLPGGTKMFFKVVIGDEGQLLLEGTIDTPY